MPRIKQDSSFDWLISTYFSNPACWLALTKGQILIEQGHYNNRLFLVRRGILQGYVINTDGTREDTLRATSHSFVGVYSFFSKTFNSIATVEALTDCEVAFIDSHQIVIPTKNGNSLEEQFMPVVIADLMRRQQRLQELALEKEQALKQLLESQKLASLGQMAAGIAHEINNAIAVLARNTDWLVEKFNARWGDANTSAIFESGLLRGRFFSSREVRQHKKKILSEYNISNAEANLLAETGISDEMLREIMTDLKNNVYKIYEAWELGATFHDMLIASEQTTHVVKSMKAMGAQHKNRQEGLDINESIQNALSLIRHKIKALSLNLELDEVPAICGNLGEFVQVWMNLIKNACEAMCHIEGHYPVLTIVSKKIDHYILVEFTDNGPGIPKEILPKIFQPNVTTKVSGLSFGLGLGLAIVQRIISEYGGTIDVKSSKEGTKFTIKIPVGGTNGKA